MKFRDPKTGNVFETLHEAHSNFCSSRECKGCGLNNYKSLLDCYAYHHENIEEMINRMDYEVVEDDFVGAAKIEEEKMEKTDKPRICEVLGVAVHARWELEEYQSSQFGVDQSFMCSKCHEWADDDDHLTPYCPNCGARMDLPEGEEARDDV